MSVEVSQEMYDFMVSIQGSEQSLADQAETERDAQEAVRVERQSLADNTGLIIADLTVAP